MSEELVVESQADEATQERARNMGWIPPEKFKGDAERFVDADEYLRRGEEVLPIVRQQNKELKAQLEAQGAAFKEMQKSLDELKISSSAETARRVEEAKAGLVEQLRAARESGDLETETRILGVLTRAEAQTPPKEDEKPRGKEPELNPDFAKWLQANASWFGKATNKETIRKTYIAQAIGAEVKMDRPELEGAAFFEEVDRRLEVEFREAPPDSKVEAGRTRASGGSGNARSYVDLPGEARKQCDADAGQFVGKGKMFETKKEFQDYWVAQYNKATGG